MRVFLCILVILTALGGPVFAQSSPILVVKIEEILRRSKAAQSITRQTEEIRTRLLADFKAKDDALKAKEDKLRSLRDDLPEDEYKAKVREFEQNVRDLRRSAQDRGKLLQEARLSSLSDLKSQLTPILAEILAEKGALVVLDETQVLLSVSGLDITGEVIAKLDQAAQNITLDFKE